MAQSAGAVEYPDCISTEGKKNHESLIYNIK